MQRYKFALVICSLMLIALSQVRAASNIEIIDLTVGTWEFRTTKNDTWLSASLPSTFHLDLLDHKVMPDPYYRDNLLQYYALEMDDWEYRTTFTVDAATLAKQVVEMVFEGLDTHTNITLNSKQIATTDNMHRTWIIDVKSALQSGSNDLVILFNSAASHDLKMSAALNASLGINLQANYSFSRKSAYQYGWDWGPRLVSAGIWKPVKIRAFDNVQVESVLFRNAKVTQNSKNSVNVYGYANLRMAQTGAYYIQVLDNNTKQVLFNDSIQTQPVLAQFRMLNDDATTEQKKNFSFNLMSPQLWWTWNIGNPYLYTFTVQILNQNNEVIDSYTTRYGIRTVEWVQQEDADKKGKSFRLELNGVPVFMKGSNYIPPDMFMPRAMKNPDVYNKTIQAAIDANHNMLRLWGGGQYEFDIFYDICDEKGILIWHDMMFACALYPGDQAMLDNIAAETRDNVRRLRNHPSIAMWNGNNEIYIGWQEWGWQNDFTDDQKTIVWGWYQSIFDSTIPTVLSEEDPDRFYWPTSPTSSQWKNYTTGDIHMWIVWASQGDIELYNTHVGRFNSEYGMQGMIPFSSIKQFTTEEDRQFNTSVMAIHERHVQGWPNLYYYMDKYFKPTKDFESFVYGTMIMQGYAVQTAIEALRRNKPYCMGSLYWQINDVWPVFSWASVDFYGQWKAVHYRGRDVYKDVVAFVTDLSNSSRAFEVYLLNDKLSNAETQLKIDILKFTGEVLATQTYHYLNIPANSRLLYSVAFQSFPNFTFDEAYVRVTLNDYYTQSLLHTNLYHFLPPINFTMPKPEIQVSYNNDSNSMTFTTTNFAYYVYIYLEDDITLKLSNNYFDLTPGIGIQSQILSTHKLADIKDSLKIQSYYDTYN